MVSLDDVVMAVAWRNDGAYSAIMQFNLIGDNAKTWPSIAPLAINDICNRYVCISVAGVTQWPGMLT